MDLYLQEVFDGLQTTLNLHKRGENIFEMGNHALFPTISNQTKWKFVRAGNTIRLSDGANIYSFHAPAGESQEEDFPLERVPDVSHHEFESGATSKGLAQVHRADPGSIYFTMQEGSHNPTYTFRHEGGKTWKAIPKKKAKKQTQVVSNVNPTSVMLGMEDTLKKKASVGEFLGDSLHNGLNGLDRLLLLPAHNPGLAALAGGTAGAGYHFGKKYLYNTPEENEDEQGIGKLLARTAIPAGLLGGYGMLRRNFEGPAKLDEWKATGRVPLRFGYGFGD